MIVELAVDDLLRRARDHLRAACVECAERVVHFGRGALDNAKSADKRLRHALFADAEVAARAFGLRPPMIVGGHLDRAEGVGLDARFGHSCLQEQKRQRPLNSQLIYFLRKRSSRTTSPPPCGLSGSPSEVAAACAGLAGGGTAAPGGGGVSFFFFFGGVV